MGLWSEFIEFVSTQNVNIEGMVSEENSSSTPLTAGAEFTGAAKEILNCGILFVNVYSDVGSAIDGLKIEQSADGINWDHDDVYTVPAGSGKNYSINPYAKYFRVRYINGAADQTVFRMQTLCKGNSKPSSHRIQDTISDDDDAELVKAVLTGKSNGTFKNVRTTVDGYLAISDRSSGLSIAQEIVSGLSFIHKFGNAPDFDTTDGEVSVWGGAEDGTAWELMKYVYSTTADIDSISSSAIGDNQEIVISGLDANYQLVTQPVTLNGRNRVALTTSLIRVFRAYNNGSTVITGHVIIYVNTALTAGVPTDKTKIRAVVDPLNQQTTMAIYTVPAGYTGYMRDWYASTAGASKNSDYIIRVISRDFGKIFRAKHVSAISDNAISSYQHLYTEPEKFLEKTDIEIRAQSTGLGATGISISAGFDIVLVEN